MSMMRASPRLPSGVLFTACDNVNRNVQMYVTSKNFNMAIDVSNECCTMRDGVVRKKGGMAARVNGLLYAYANMLFCFSGGSKMASKRHLGIKNTERRKKGEGE